jgi:regulator of sirC expression with transglutaminase-like and TPR domain
MRIVFSILLLLMSTLPCAALTFENKQLEAQVETLFAPSRDLLDVKLAVDAMAGGTATDTKSEIDQLAAKLVAMAAGAETSHEKVKILRRFIYEPGEWNGDRAFAYDLSDPLGTKPANRHLAQYLETRRGNCVTMPMLMAILGQRIGLKMTLAVAPFHVLVKYTDDDGAVWNLEATSGGGFTRDAWYRKELPMGDEALAKGTYLRPLDATQNTALIASFLVEHLMTTGRFEDAIVAADIILKHDPSFAYVQVKRGSAYYLLLKRDVIDRYQRQSDMSPEVIAHANELHTQNLAAFAAAESLGWRETDGVKSSQTTQAGITP